MKEVYYVYNNEAIASCIFLSIFNRVEGLDIARCCLVLPFLLDDRTINYLSKNKNCKLENMIREQSRLFISFNKRYLSLLPVTINSLTILNASNQISIENEVTTNTIIDFDDITVGDRFTRIQEVIPTFLSMIEIYSTIQLYRMLKIQL
ncbi:three component ABC system middle component [Empedobacter sp. UBA7620]|uniref:three component ABC system middle component n=1 Tax=Empedobacter sp. UBA7620 TaxID=1946452 RepID=UPI0025C66FFD|nr:three component ABC system middle component [Empedobacter sp. UBA7620]